MTYGDASSPRFLTHQKGYELFEVALIPSSVPTTQFFDQVLKPQFQLLENGFVYDEVKYIGGLLFYRGASIL